MNTDYDHSDKYYQVYADSDYFDVMKDALADRDEYAQWNKTIPVPTGVVKECAECATQARCDADDYKCRVCRAKG